MMTLCKTFKEARKVARELSVTCGYGCWAYIGRIEKGKDKGCYIADYHVFPEAQFYVHKDGRVCKFSNIENENKKWKRHPEMQGHAYPFVYRPRNRKPEEDKNEYLKSMAISGRCEF